MHPEPTHRTEECAHTRAVRLLELQRTNVGLGLCVEAPDPVGAKRLGKLVVLPHGVLVERGDRVQGGRQVVRQAQGELAHFNEALCPKKVHPENISLYHR